MGRRKIWIGVFILFLFVLPGCEVVAKIFAAGVIIGIIIVVVIIALIIWAISKFID